MKSTAENETENAETSFARCAFRCGLRIFFVTAFVMRGASRVMPSVAENENNRETSPAQNGFNKHMVKTATARELSGSAWRPRRMPKSKISCIMPLRTTEAESPETNIKSSVNTAETSAAGRRFSPSRPRKPRVNCVKIAMCMPDMAKMCEAPAFL